MGIANLSFQFRWVPTLLLALPIPAFIYLGLWQLDRAEYKRELAATLANRAQLPPVLLSETVVDPESLRYRAVEATGAYVAYGQFLVEGRRDAGKTGFHVITPLRLAGSDALLLVNRGWIPGNTHGEPTEAPVPAGPLTVVGEGEIPSEPALVLHDGEEAAETWGARWPYVTLELFAATVEAPVLPLMVLLDQDAPGGFSRHWSHPLPNAGMHLGYAIQWFGFAAIALVLYLRLSLVRPAANPRSELTESGK